MATRRSLADGVNAPKGVDPDVARAFIKQESDPADTPRGEPLELSVLGGSNDPSPIGETGSSPRRPTGKTKNQLVPVGLIPVTVRLRPQIAGALKRASLERQLQGEDVYTQQDLVEQVLEPWLRTNRYLTD